jgi:hypothetical protein
MKIVTEYSGEYQDMINSYYNLEQYNDDSKTEVLFQGYSTSVNDTLKEEHKDYENRVYMNLEAPCAYCSTTNCNNEQEYFTHIYTICPYTAEWMNKSSKTKFFPIPFPFNKKSFEHLNYDLPKTNDVMYMGHLLGDEHYRIIDIMRDYKYVFSAVDGNYPPPYQPTHTNIHSSIKWELLAKSKVSIAMNLAPINPLHIQYIKQYPNWEENEAFKSLESGYIPQFKPRIIESMMCKTLVLVKYDEWNVIEKWFTPNQHFIYWHSLEDLYYKLYHIVNNHGMYRPIVDAAYEKVQEYEVNEIYKKIAKYESL